MIVVRVIGGVGNQIFQYLFGQYLENKFKQIVYYDIIAFQTVNLERIFELKLLFPDIRIYEGDEFKFSRNIKFKSKFLVFLYKLKKGKHYISECSIDTIKCLKKEETYYFDGYWQDIKMINEIYPNFKKNFNINTSIPSGLKDIVNKIKSNYSISIHVRRGDYFTPKNIKIYGVCSENYYNKAIEVCENKHQQKLTFFIFSDDLDWVKKHLILPNNSVFVPNLNINNYWYIYLMSICKENIISNSSFSWWGAYINEYSQKKVISPKQWTLNSNNSIVLSDWLKL